MPTFKELFTDALTRIRVARAGDVMAPEDEDYLKLLFNGILDAWNGEARAVYAVVLNDFTFTPNLSPHTIGPTGTFNVTQRPEEIVDAAVKFTATTPNVFTPIHVRDQGWYARQAVPTRSDAFPTDVFYEKDWPNGKLYFVGVPTSAYGVRLWLRTLLAAVADTGADFSMPPGYQEALTLTLAKKAAPGFGQSWSTVLEDERREAVTRVFGENDREYPLATADAGIPSAQKTGGGRFDWLTRSWN